MYLHLKMSIPFSITAVICKSCSSKGPSRERIKGKTERESLLCKSGQNKARTKKVQERQELLQKKKKPTREHSSGLERLQAANGWTPALPVSEGRGARSEAVPRGFHVGKHSSYATYVTVFWNAFFFFLYEHKQFALLKHLSWLSPFSLCAAGNLEGWLL